jgi:hypothetical protein
MSQSWWGSWRRSRSRAWGGEDVFLGVVLFTDHEVGFHHIVCPSSVACKSLPARSLESSYFLVFVTTSSVLL